MPRKTRKELIESDGVNEELIQSARDLGCRLLTWSLHRQWRRTRTPTGRAISQITAANLKYQFKQTFLICAI